MGGPTKHFYVDPDKLMTVAQQVDNLNSMIAEGNTPGNLPNLTQDAAPDALAKQLSVFWAGGGTDPYAKAYRAEHDGLVSTYKTMSTQLQNLAQACRTTAQAYQTQDQHSSRQVTNSGGENTQWRK